MAIHGEDATLALPDPNVFDGAMRICRPEGVARVWEEVPYSTRGPRDCRGLGLEDLVAAVAEKRQPRASGRLAAHVVDIATTGLAAAAEGRTAQVASSVERPPPLD